MGKPIKSTKTRSIAYVGLTIAIMAVSAWVVVPIGGVPFTLQTFAMVFALLVLQPKECLAAIGGYLALGAVGVPVFSVMRGGFGVLAGPTGGFLWGYALGACVALAVLHVIKNRGFSGEVLCGVLFTLVSYVCGWLQFMLVMGVSPIEAAMVALVPFVVVDAVKVVVAVGAARSVRKALPCE